MGWYGQGAPGSNHNIIGLLTQPGDAFVNSLNYAKLTFAGWMYHTTTANAGLGVLYAPSSGNASIGACLISGTFSAQYSAGTTTNCPVLTGAVVTGAWHFVAVAFGSTGTLAYVKNVNTGVESFATGSYVQSSVIGPNVYIGQNFATYMAVDSMLAEVSLWQTALNLTDLRQLAAGRNPKTYGRDAQLRFYFPLRYNLESLVPGIVYPQMVFGSGAVPSVWGPHPPVQQPVMRPGWMHGPLLPTVAEIGNAVDAVGVAPSSYGTTAADSGAATDTVTAVKVTAASIAETGIATDATNAAVVFAATVAESGAAADVPASSPPAIVTTTSGNSAGGYPLAYTQTYTVTTESLLLAYYYTASSYTWTPTATFGAQTMTLIGQATGGNNRTIWAWYLLAPVSGAGTLTISNPGQYCDVAVGYIVGLSGSATGTVLGASSILAPASAVTATPALTLLGGNSQIVSFAGGYYANIVSSGASPASTAVSSNLTNANLPAVVLSQAGGTAGSSDTLSFSVPYNYLVASEIEVLGGASASGLTAWVIRGATVAESGAASDAPAAAPSVFIGVVAETGAAVDLLAPVYTASVSETGAAADQCYLATVWDASTAVYMTISSGGTIATANSSSSYGVVRTTTSHGSGKYYAEFSGYNSSQNFQRIGFVNASFALTSGNTLGGDLNSVGDAYRGTVYSNGASIGTQQFYATAGDILMVAIDIAAMIVWFGLNGAWTASDNPATDTGGVSISALNAGPYFMAYTNVATVTINQLLNVQSATLTYTPPSGFVAWNSPGSTATIWTASITETGAATDAPATTANVFIGTTAVSANAVDLPSAVAQFAAAITETGAASDVPSAGAGFAATIAENGAAADQANVAAGFVSSIAESGATADLPNATAVFAATLSDTGAGVDLSGAAAVFVSGVLEAGTAVDSATVGAGFVAAVADTSAAADLVDAVAVFAGSISEAGVASEAVIVTAVDAELVIEQGIASDQADAAGVLRCAISETGSGSDVGDAAVLFTGVVVDAGLASDATDTLIGYGVATSETLVLTDTTDLTASDLAAVSDTGSTADAVDAIGAYAGAVLDAAAATDAADAAISYSVETLETGDAAEVTGLSAVAGCAAVETGTLAESASATILHGGAGTDAGNAADATDAIATYAAMVAELGAAADQLGTTDSHFIAAISETGSVSDAADTGSGTGYGATSLEAAAVSDLTDVAQGLWVGQTSETGASTDAADSTAVFAAAQVEALAALDTLNAGASFVSSVSELGAAQDASTATAGYNAACTEAGAATDGASTGALFTAGVSETGDAGDADDAQVLFQAAVLEAAAAQDGVNTGTGTGYGVGILEVAVAMDLSNVIALFAADAVEVAAASDTVSPAPSVFGAAVDDLANIADRAAVVAYGTLTLAEFAMAMDATDAGLIHIAAVAEAGEAADAVDAEAQYTCEVIDLCALLDAVTAGQTFAPPPSKSRVGFGAELRRASYGAERRKVG